MKKEAIIDAVIPAYRPGAEFRELLKRLMAQSRPLRRIIIMNTRTEVDMRTMAEDIPWAEIHELDKSEFDHGGTRDAGARLSDADYLLFLTQDALPADEYLVERLAAAFTEPQIKAAYARQLARPDCRELERYTRIFNYPEESRVKTAADLDTLGIKTFFCSNVCAMYERETYVNRGGFIRKTIFNEDMIFAGHAVEAGYQIAYAADAQVIHSHNYTAMQQLHRNFDLGVSQADHPEVFGRLHSEGEGIRLVKKTAKWLVENGHVLLLPQLVMASGSKYAGYWLGKHYKKLPEGLIRSLTMNPAYWEGEVGDGR